MSKRLPTVAQLQAVEAAARHLSFLKAAEELHVTAPAISHRVRDYESLTGMTLFERDIRKIHLTTVGKQILPSIQKILAELTDLSHTSRSKQIKQRRLKVAVPPMLFSQLILPNLADFYRHNPNSDFEFEVTQNNRELKKYDLVTLYGFSPTKSWFREKLMTATLVAVYSRRVHRSIPTKDRTQFLLQHCSLIHFSYAPELWTASIERFDVDKSRIVPGLTVNSMGQAVIAAKSGLGIAIAVKELIEEDLQQGTLLLCPEIKLGQSAFYLSRPRKSASSELDGLRRWIKQLAIDRSKSLC